jgi:hypothetical protein
LSKKEAEMNDNAQIRAILLEYSKLRAFVDGGIVSSEASKTGKKCP